MSSRWPAYLSLPLCCILILLGPAAVPLMASSYEECLLHALTEGADSLTLGEIKESCQVNGYGQLESADQQPGLPDAEPEQQTAVPEPHMEVFSVKPHKQNYILLYSYNRAPNTTHHLAGQKEYVDHKEVTFQISLKFPITSFRINDQKTHVMAAYTAQSFWQAYNKTLSSPFRETNHEPEIFVVHPISSPLPGVNTMYLMGGIVHQSNGRSQPQSRSWNRIYLDFVLEGDNFKLSIKPWYRIPEENKKYVGSANGDDNPDISDYLGYGEISGAFKIDDHTLSFLIRNNLEYHHNKGALKLGWSFKMPFIKANNLKGYIQYFTGYGESLIDYDVAVQRIGMGIILADWF